MLRWARLPPKCSGPFSKNATSKLSLFVNRHQSCLNSCLPRRGWPPDGCPQWQQSRLYAEKVLIPSPSEQDSGPLQQPELDSNSLSTEGFRDLLDEAASYSIHDVKTLDTESAVTGNERRITRLAERPEHQFDYRLWEILLKYRLRVYGDRGIRSIWKFLTRRAHLRIMPAHWPNEDSLWSIFVDLGLRDHEFLTLIAEHAKQLWRQRKLRRRSLYVEVIGGLLNSENPAAGPIFSPLMHPGASITSAELLQLFVQASNSANTSALEHFCLICDTVPKHMIYRKVILSLCKQERVSEAMVMHDYLVRRHDYPKTFRAIEPLVRQLAQSNLDLSALIRPLEDAGVSFSQRAQELYNSVKKSKWGFAREDIDLARSRIFRVKRSTISDAFAARFFATKSFSFEFALHGVHLLGLKELGPLSLREIALHAGNATLIRQRLSKVDNVGIDTGASVYARVIKQLVKEGKDDLLMDVVHCDQHPDAFEDQQVQLKLLANYHISKDWRQVNRTLAVLKAIGDTRLHAPNASLRGALMRREWPEVMKIAARMHRDGIHIFRANIILMYKSIFLPREPGDRVSLKANEPDDLLLLITLLQQSLKSGADVPSKVWCEPLRRLGIMGRWDDLGKACEWLCSFYLSKNVVMVPNCYSEDSTVLPAEEASCNPRQVSIIHEIISPALQRAIVERGFLVGLSKQHTILGNQAVHLKRSRVLREAPWICGLQLLCGLERRFGMCLHVVAIKTALLERLRQLFSSGGHSKLFHNRLHRARNKAKLQFYLGWINKVYGQVLFDERNPRTKSSILLRRRLRPKEMAKSLHLMSRSLDARQKNASEQQTLDEGETSMCEQDIVMYRDVFHASWEDYRS